MIPRPQELTTEILRQLGDEHTMRDVYRAIVLLAKRTKRLDLGEGSERTSFLLSVLKPIIQFRVVGFLRSRNLPWMDAYLEYSLTKFLIEMLTETAPDYIELAMKAEGDPWAK